MKTVGGVLAVLLGITIALAGSSTVAGEDGSGSGVALAAQAQLRADQGAVAGEFIKPAEAPPSLVERSEEQRSSEGGATRCGRRGSTPFSPHSLLHNEPPPPPAHIRRALLNVYRL